MITRIIVILSATMLATAAGSQPTVSPSPDGARLFDRQCALCHDGMPRAPGPDLTGIVGAPVAWQKGFTYSAALRKAGGVWTPERLDRFLAAPSTFAPGTSMAISVRNAADRQSIIAALRRNDGR